MAEQKVTTEVDPSVTKKPSPYNHGEAFFIWMIFIVTWFFAILYKVCQDGEHLAFASVFVIILARFFPRYVMRNVVGHYVYLNINKSNGGDRLECRVYLEPTLWRSCIIRLPIGGWFRRAAVIKAPIGIQTYVDWRVKVLGDPYCLHQPTLQLTDIRGEVITSHDPQMVYHILSHPFVFKALSSLKDSQQQEREAVGSWLQLYQTVQKNPGALHSSYGQFLMLYAEAFFVRRFGSEANLRELANMDYPDETAGWSTVVDEHGYLLSAQGRRAHEMAKAAAAAKARSAD